MPPGPTVGTSRVPGQFSRTFPILRCGLVTMDCETQKGRVGHPSGQRFWSVFFFMVHVPKLNACGPLPPFLPPSHIWRAHTTMRVRYCQYNNASTAMLVQGDSRVVLDLLTKIFNAWKKSLKGKPCSTNFPAWEISNAAEDLTYLTKISYYNRYRNTKEIFCLLFMCRVKP